MNTAVHPVLKDITEVESTEKNGKASQRHIMQETNRILQFGKKVTKCRREITASIVLIGLLEEL